MSKNLDEYYKKNLPNCPKCGTSENVIRSVYGKPSRELAEYASAGNVQLMGCCLPMEASKRAKAKCKKCDTIICETDLK